MGLLLLTLTICGLVLHSWLIIEIQLSNPCVGPYPRTNMSFFLLSVCVEELISAPKINTFWPNPLPGNVRLDLLSKLIP